MFSKLVAPCFKINGPPFRISQLAQRRVWATRWHQRRPCRHHDGGHDTVPGRCRRRSGRIRRGTIGDTSWSEACRGVPERQRRRCLRGRRGVETQRFCFESRDEWQCQNCAPSVVSQTFKHIGPVSPGNPKFGHRLLRGIFPSAWKTLPMLRRRDDGTTFLPCETLRNTDGTLSTATSLLMMDSVVSSRSRLSRNSVVRLLIGVTSCMATRLHVVSLARCPCHKRGQFIQLDLSHHISRWFSTREKSTEIRKGMSNNSMT